jgi:hypothetical protein
MVGLAQIEILMATGELCSEPPLMPPPEAEAFFGFFVNLPAIRPSLDTAREFRLLANTFEAECGSNSGLTINGAAKFGLSLLIPKCNRFFIRIAGI